MRVNYLNQRLHNLFHSALLILALLAILWLLGWFFAGWYGVLWATCIGIPPLVLSLRLHPRLVLGMYGARSLTPAEAPQLFAIITELGRRAGIAPLPGLYYVASRAALVFSVGRGKQAAIAVSDGMLRLLTLRELVCVLGHELSHIQNNDTWVMSFADVVSRVTSTLSFIGQILVLVNLPLYFFGDHALPWVPLLIMATAPMASALLQLALSRAREFSADLSAVQLTGDPEGLAVALAKLEEYQHRVLGSRGLRGYHGAEPSLLRTHPATAERLQRLKEIRDDFIAEENLVHSNSGIFTLPPHLHPERDRPRRRLGGFWN
ncbi:MAG TPA: zinc metalloprotease HtpX [Geobacteraceae bacterium]